jgi:hypothetical protein
VKLQLMWISEETLVALMENYNQRFQMVLDAHRLHIDFFSGIINFKVLRVL